MAQPLDASFYYIVKNFHRELRERTFVLIQPMLVQPEQQNDASLGGFAEQKMMFTRPKDQIPDFDRLVIRTRDDLRAIMVEANRLDPIVEAVRVRLLDDQNQG